MKSKTLLLIVCSLLMLVGCGKNSEQTANLTNQVNVRDVTVSCNNQGEDAQNVVLTFSVDSKAENIQVEDFAVTLAGEEFTSDKLTVEAGEDTVTLTVHISALKFGQLSLSYTGTSMAHFTCEGIITPGVELSEAVNDSQTGTAKIQVLHAWDVRGAVQLQMWENGILVPTQGDEPSDTTAVHGHDFLNIDCETAAANIAAALSESYPDGYSFTSQGDTVIIEKSNPDGTVNFELTVLGYLTLK